MSDARDMIGATIYYHGKLYKVIGVTYNILGTWLQLENGGERISVKEDGHEPE